MNLSDFFEKLSNVSIGFNDIVDIILVALLFLLAFRFVRNRSAGRLLIGICLLVALYVISDIFQMMALNFILEGIFSVGLMALVVVFQPELRTALEKMAEGSFKKIKGGSSDAAVSAEQCIIEISRACEAFSESKTGALIVLERSTKLDDYANGYTVIDAEPSEMLIGNLFYNKAPLHDGAVIIRNGRIHAAGCVLPLSSNPNIIKELGTRHRAGIGITECSDAVAVIVSEETGNISVACDGKLRRGFTGSGLERELRNQLGIDKKQGTAKRIIGKVRELAKKGGDGDAGK